MPCKSDYMAPTGYELKIVATAKLLKYVAESLGRDVHPDVEYLSQDCNYSCVTRVKGDAIVESLCTVMRGLNADTIDRVVYQTRSRDARALADWWEEHQAADRKREAKENKDKLDRGYLFPKGSGVPSEKKDQIMEWYKNLGGTGQSYVNLLLLVRDNRDKKVATDVSKD